MRPGITANSLSGCNAKGGKTRLSGFKAVLWLHGSET